MFPPKRVFILGAGASRAASLSRKWKAPLVEEFFTKEFREVLANSKMLNFKWDNLQGFLERYFQFDPATNDRINIEDVLSFLEVTQTHIGHHRSSERFIPAVREEILKYLVNLIAVVSIELDNPIQNPSVDFYRTLAGGLRANDSIVTLNWDTLLEQALAATKSNESEALFRGQAAVLHPTLSFGNWDPSEQTASQFMELVDRAYLLKLHGSVNLGVCPNSECPRRHLPFRFGLSDYWGVEWPCDACGDTLEPLIVPPQFNKAYERSRFTKLQFNLASNQLEWASEIVIVGCSFSPFDFAMQALLRGTRIVERVQVKSFERKIIVVDPKVKEILPRVRSLMGDSGKSPNREFIAYDDVTKFEKEYLASR